MNIKTKYKDIPWEAVGHFQPGYSKVTYNATWDKNMRGKPLVIDSIPLTEKIPCGKRLFKVINTSAVTRRGNHPESVCECLAEIGD